MLNFLSPKKAEFSALEKTNLVSKESMHVAIRGAAGNQSIVPLAGILSNVNFLSNCPARTNWYFRIISHGYDHIVGLWHLPSRRFMSYCTVCTVVEHLPSNDKDSHTPDPTLPPFPSLTIQVFLLYNCPRSPLIFCILPSPLLSRKAMLQTPVPLIFLPF